jgi:hypothetical protein
VLLLLAFATQLGLGTEAPWYLLSLVANGYVPWIAVALGLVWLAVAAQLATIAFGRYAAYPTARSRRPRLLVRFRPRRRAPVEEAEALEG